MEKFSENLRKYELNTDYYTMFCYCNKITLMSDDINYFMILEFCINTITGLPHQERILSRDIIKMDFKPIGGRLWTGFMWLTTAINGGLL
jgi:hypothetical protein